MEKTFSRFFSRVYSGAITFQQYFSSLQKCELPNCANDSTMYLLDKRINSAMISMNHRFPILLNRFCNDVVVQNSDKCFFILFGLKDELQTDLVSNNVPIRKRGKVAVITYDKLDFSKHLTSITKKGNIKLKTLTRVQKYITQSKISSYHHLLQSLSLIIVV